MPKGGKRPGSGRPKGALTTRTREIAEKAFAAGITPLEMMLKAMTVHHDNGDWDKAARKPLRMVGADRGIIERRHDADG